MAAGEMPAFVSVVSVESDGRKRPRMSVRAEAGVARDAALLRMRAGCLFRRGPIQVLVATKPVNFAI
jgi:hypothetical protein